ncbi:hypothetical protein DAI22_02g378500 [Oryza sativa Japonica Group]|nr:hypothetical protein DAI22_02g378500 [Oryza sativa Japonica Group]KAF2947573.1 hypothetical protein DAI22_02g378500 [Oryza sativa Japonica Group]
MPPSCEGDIPSREIVSSRGLASSSSAPSASREPGNRRSTSVPDLADSSSVAPRNPIPQRLPHFTSPAHSHLASRAPPPPPRPLSSLLMCLTRQASGRAWRSNRLGSMAGRRGWTSMLRRSIRRLVVDPIRSRQHSRCRYLSNLLPLSRSSSSPARESTSPSPSPDSA